MVKKKKDNEPPDQDEMEEPNYKADDFRNVSGPFLWE